MLPDLGTAIREPIKLQKELTTLKAITPCPGFTSLSFEYLIDGRRHLATAEIPSKDGLTSREAAKAIQSGGLELKPNRAGAYTSIGGERIVPMVPAKPLKLREPMPKDLEALSRAEAKRARKAKRNKALSQAA